MHANRQIREAVAARLTATGRFGVVATNRGANLDDVDLPAAIVGTGSDEVEVQSKDEPPLERRTIDLTVVIVADGSSDTLDDDMDALRAAVETALAGDLDGLAARLDHTGAELQMGEDEDGHRWYAFYALSWEAVVWTHEGDPETVL